MFGRLKDWRRVATRYDRCPKVFLSAFALAATVMFWLRDAVTGPASRPARYCCKIEGKLTPFPTGRGSGNAVLRTDADHIEHADEMGTSKLH